MLVTVPLHLDLLVGRDNPGDSQTAAAEPGNQMAGYDFRLRSPWAAAPVAMPVAAAPAVQAAPAEAPAAPPAGKVIKSPMVGTFYRAASPGAKPFVDVGDAVKAGQAVCIIEAMKIMNEIESDLEGRIAKLLCENGQAVEFGQPLFVLE